MPEDQGVKDGVRRRGFKLNEAFRILGISDGTDHSLVKKGKLRVVRLGKRLPIVSDEEIDRVLKEGIQ
jgi:predicted site-specific integrase-resolvase